jgi:uncharacterized membrane protein YfcA
MELIDAILLIIVGIGAGFVQRVSGFGLGIFAMLFLPHFLPSHTAAATIVGICSMVTSSYNAVKYRKDIPYRTILPLLFSAMISIPIAVYFSSRVPKGIFEILLGVVLVLLSFYFLFFNKSIKIKASTLNGAISGTLSGVLNGLFSTGGPPAVLYLTHATTTNAAYFAGIQFYFGLTNIYASVMRVFSGLVTLDVLIMSAFGLFGCLLGDFLGKGVFDKLDGEKLKKIIYIGMIVSGIVMII